MTTQTYRRARHSVSLRPAHLVFVTKNRRPVFTDAMLTFAEHTMRTVARRPHRINGETDHVHLLMANPPTLAISVLVQRPKGRTFLRDAACIHRALRSDRHAWTPRVAVLLRRLLRRRTSINHRAIHRRTSPPAMNGGPRPPKTGWAHPD